MSSNWVDIVDDSCLTLEAILDNPKDHRVVFESIALISKIMTQEGLEAFYYDENFQLVKDPDGTLHLVSHGVE
ncbi:MAG: hypothetical protein KUG64_10840 [Cycloclasticus sp.]|nr:hypothetical protein [Cycloclasticus sp.]